MIKKILLILQVLFISQVLSAQDDIYDNDTTSFTGIQQAVYFELLGSAGLMYNITFDNQFYEKNDSKLSYAVGLQYLPVSGGFFSSYFSLSPQLNYFCGKTHHFETGIGTVIYSEQDSPGVQILKGFITRIGYRYQKKGKTFFKAALTPIFYSDSESQFRVLPWAGIAVGYCFK